MSDLWFNIRFGTIHFQWGPNRWPKFTANNYLKRNKPERWFEVYAFFGISGG